MLSRAELLSKKTLKHSTVKIALGEVGIRELNGREREDVFALLAGAELAITPGMQSKVALWCVVDENLDPVFEPGDEEKINAMGGKALEAIVLGVLALSGMTDASAEEIEKNSDSEPSGVTGSGSLKLSAAQ